MDFIIDLPSFQGQTVIVVVLALQNSTLWHVTY